MATGFWPIQQGNLASSSNPLPSLSSGVRSSLVGQGLMQEVAAGPSLRQSYAKIGTPTSISSVVVQAGDIIFVTYTSADALETLTCADSVNTYTQLGTGHYDANAANCVYAWQATAATSTTLTITISSPNGTGAQIYVGVVSGATGVDAWGFGSAEGSSGTSHTGASLTLTQANDYVLTTWAEWSTGGVTWTDGQGLSSLQSSSTGTISKFVGGTVSSSGTWADTATTSSGAYCVSVTAA